MGVYIHMKGVEGMRMKKEAVEEALIPSDMQQLIKGKKKRRKECQRRKKREKEGEKKNHPHKTSPEQAQKSQNIHENSYHIPICSMYIIFHYKKTAKDCQKSIHNRFSPLSPAGSKSPWSPPFNNSATILRRISGMSAGP